MNDKNKKLKVLIAATLIFLSGWAFSVWFSGIVATVPYFLGIGLCIVVDILEQVSGVSVK
jgi:hypothetical protein